MSARDERIALAAHAILGCCGPDCQMDDGFERVLDAPVLVEFIVLVGGGTDAENIAGAMTAANLDPEVCRRIAADLTAQYEFCEQHGYGFKARSAFDAIGQLTAAAEMAERHLDLVERHERAARAINSLEGRLAEVSKLLETECSLSMNTTNTMLKAQAECDALRAQLAGRPALTDDEVRAAVREAVHAEHGSRGWGCTDGAATGIAIRVAKKLAGRSLAAAPAPQVVGIGPADTVVIVEALDTWDRYLTAPHAEIARIRALLTGTVPS